MTHALVPDGCPTNDIRCPNNALPERGTGHNFGCTLALLSCRGEHDHHVF
jgi:hypothetical protein